MGGSGERYPLFLMPGDFVCEKLILSADILFQDFSDTLEMNFGVKRCCAVPIVSWQAGRQAGAGRLIKNSEWLPEVSVAGRP